MNTALYDIYNGLAARFEELDVVSNNLANVSSTGYKQDGVFQRLLEANLSANPQAQGSVRRMPRVATYVDFQNGDLVQTGRPMDLGIQGKGFFVVQGAAGEVYYTRDGSFSQDDAGNLLTASGDRVMGDGAAVSIPQGDRNVVTVDEEGGISVDGIRSTSLKVVEFDDGAILQKIGSNYFVDKGGAVPKDAESTTVSQGFLEKSNVSAIKAMVEMMQVMRQAESLQRTLNVILNDIDGRVIREVARV